MEIGIYKCPECGSDRVIYLPFDGHSVCQVCGTVVEENLPVDSRKGLKTGSFMDSYGPAQEPWTYRLKKGSTFGFQGGFRDASGKYIPPKNKQKFWRLRRLQVSLEDGNIRNDLAMFRNIADRIGTPHFIKMQASRIFWKVLRKKLTRGRTIEAITGAALFIAYKMNKYSKSIVELSEEISVPKKKIFHCYQVLVRELKIKVNNIPKAEDFVPRICTEVKADIIIEKSAIEIIKKFKNKVDVTGKDPKGIAAASVYLASEEEYRKNPLEYKKITQEKISFVGKVTEVTLRQRCRDIRKALSSG